MASPKSERMPLRCLSPTWLIRDGIWFEILPISWAGLVKEEAFPHIQKAFQHEEFRVRREAVQALGLIGGPEAIGLLVKALADGDARIRAMAALGLGSWGKKPVWVLF